MLSTGTLRTTRACLATCALAAMTTVASPQAGSLRDDGREVLLRPVDILVELIDVSGDPVTDVGLVAYWPNGSARKILRRATIGETVNSGESGMLAGIPHV